MDGWGDGFGTIGGLLVAVAILAFGVIAIGMFRGVYQWQRNSRSPLLSVDARVSAKRTSVTYRHPSAGEGEPRVSTTRYFVTFEVESGDRIEFGVEAEEYAMLADGDYGKLSFQGTRYIDFVRLRRFEAYR